jgi:phage gpG-like protein
MGKNSTKIHNTQRLLQKQLKVFVKTMGVEALNHFKGSFRNQGFTNTVLRKWTGRKRQERGRQRAILVKTGRLKRSVRVVRKTLNSVTLGSDVPYAIVHNEGQGKMPKREFIGDSKKLEKLLIKELNKKVLNAFKQFK